MSSSNMAPPIKRQASESFSNGTLVKRQKSDSNLNNGALIQQSTQSTLSSPILELTGHTSEILTCRFSPSSHTLASGGLDRQILLWHTSGTCENYGTLSGHKGAITDLSFSHVDDSILFSASSDTHVASWDLETGTRVRRHVGHEDVVNSVDVSRRGQELLISGSDDGTIGIWDPRQKHCVSFLATDYPVCAVALAEAGNELYSGGVDNTIRVWDARKMDVAYSLAGHNDVITSLETSPDGQTLLSNCMDGTVRTWDIRPFAPKDRSIAVFDGAGHGIEKNLIRASWSQDGAKIASGSGEGSVMVWEVRTGRLVGRLPGHRGCVNDVRFSTDGKLVVSASTDRKLILGEVGK